MLVTPDDFKKAFDELKKDCHDSMASVTVLVGPNVDALCAQRILARIFDRFFMQFKSVAVTSYTHMQQLLQKESAREMSWIMLNCGAAWDALEKHIGDSHKVYILDTFRPISLANLYHKRIRVFDLGDTGEQLWERMGIDEGGKPKTEKDDPPRKKPRKSDSSDSSVPSLEGDQVDEDDEVLDGEQRKPDDEDEDATPGKQRNEITATEEEEYYRYSTHTMSSAVITFKLAEALNHSDKEDVLWMAICGLTERYISGRLSKDKYRTIISEFLTLVQNRAALKPRKVVLQDGFSTSKFNESLLEVSEELMFMLLRHWSLYESLTHSSCSVSQLKLYQGEQGKRTIDTLFSKIGIPPQHRTAAYTALPAADQKTLRAKLSEQGKAFGLHDYTFMSFIKSQGYGFTLSASDLVYCIGAIMEQPSESEADYRRHFWAAYEALGSDSSDTIRSGIDSAKIQQEVIVRQAAPLIQSVQVNSQFRWAMISQETDPTDLAYICRPMVLQRMARYLLETRNAKMKDDIKRQIRDNTANKRQIRRMERNETLPFLLACPICPDTGYSIVVGVYPETATGTSLGSRFRTAFGRASKAFKDQDIRLDGLDLNTVEVATSCWPSFANRMFLAMNGEKDPEEEP
eukprot:NODE_577_length_2295_cov_26.152394_g547_i0.p1 GENE.NODE_577_length_2295_cov_26.152394_g547_i0~~NODE_577_length_2295_cov_26.152394_g547_i0.p1  ORF type:complete len:630 (+),score=116.55 NODE_577_length_2295_cov_26.152394_g547_i0:35-1924(+)